MKFIDAIEKMDEGDIFKCENSDEIICCNNGTFRFRSSNIIVNVAIGNMMLDGEIIPAEPKVQSVDETFKKDYAPVDTVNHTKIKNGYYMGFKAGKPEGRLEMYLEFKKAYEEDGPGTIPVFFNALKNLKPW